MKIKFENHSISGIYREYAGFILNIPGHAIGNKAVVAKVPDELATDVKRFISANHPCVVITDIDGEEAEPQAPVASEEAEPVADQSTGELEPAAEEPVEAIEDGQGEEAEPQGHRRNKKGGK